MYSSLLLKKLLALSDNEFTLFSQTVKDAQWDSFDELMCMFPENDANLATIRYKIEDYIAPKNQAL